MKGRISGNEEQGVTGFEFHKKKKKRAGVTIVYYVFDLLVQEPATITEFIRLSTKIGRTKISF
jgi:hypothetical protein